MTGHALASLLRTFAAAADTHGDAPAVKAENEVLSLADRIRAARAAAPRLRLVPGGKGK